MNSIRRAKISKLVIIIKTWLIEVKEDDMVVISRVTLSISYLNER
jgi:hypothetical protein